MNIQKKRDKYHKNHIIQSLANDKTQIIETISKREVNLIENANHTIIHIKNKYIIDMFLFSLSNRKYLYRKNKAITVIKNNHSSSFKSFVDWNHTIGSAINILDNITGRLKNDFFNGTVDFIRFERTTTRVIKLKNKPEIFIKKAGTGLPNIYQIPVKVCQEYIIHKESRFHASAIKWGVFIYEPKSSHQIGKGLTIDINQVDKTINAKIVNNSAEKSLI